MINRQALRDASGATAVEYGLMIALLAIAAIPAIGTMDEEVSNTYSEVDTSMAEHGGLASAPGIGASSVAPAPVSAIPRPAEPTPASETALAPIPNP